MDERLRLQIVSIHQSSKSCYGAPRIHAELRADGVHIGKKRVARLMRMAGLKPKKRRHFRAATVSAQSYPIAGNVLNRQFTAALPNAAWVADVTYFSTREGWLYLAAVLDLFSRKVIGWSMSPRNDTQLVLSALNMAMQRRSPSNDVLVHTDRGSQYASLDYRRFIANRCIVPSMSRKGDCWDNAVMESFFASLKVELKPERLWATRSEARTAIFEYIESWYNRQRRHSTISYLSPVEFEKCQHVT